MLLPESGQFARLSRCFMLEVSACLCRTDALCLFKRRLRKPELVRRLAEESAETPKVQRLGNVACPLPPMDCHLTHPHLYRHFALG